MHNFSHASDLLLFASISISTYRCVFLSHPFEHTWHVFLQWPVASCAGCAGITNTQVSAMLVGHLTAEPFLFCRQLEFGHAQPQDQTLLTKNCRQHHLGLILVHTDFSDIQITNDAIAATSGIL